MMESAVYCAGNMSVLPTLPSASFDSVLTDPPFGQANESYDEWPDPRVWAQCFRLAKAEACLVSFAGNPTYHRLATDIEGAGWKVKQMWAWIYPDGLITSARPKEGFDRLAPALTPIVFAVKGCPVLALHREGKPWERGRSGKQWSERASQERRTEASGHWPRSVVCTGGLDGFQFFHMPFAAIPARKGEDRHPNEKPLPLIRWLLDKLPGTRVLDPYAGSGTTGAAALLAGKSFCLVERSAGYFGMLKQRLEKAALGVSGP